jgi:hypothetical protein
MKRKGAGLALCGRPAPLISSATSDELVGNEKAKLLEFLHIAEIDWF